MTTDNSSFFVNLGNNLKKHFIIGLLVIVPVAVTIWILLWVFNAIDSILKPIIVFVFGRTFPGIGFVATILIIYLTGLLSTNIVGKRLFLWLENMLLKIPVVRPLYLLAKRIVLAISAPRAKNLMQVVMVHFPNKETYTIGFVTNESLDGNGNKRISVLVPLAPNPVSGFLLLVSEKDIIRTKIRLDDAIKIIVSAGTHLPDDFGHKTAIPKDK